MCQTQNDFKQIQPDSLLKSITSMTSRIEMPVYGLKVTPSILTALNKLDVESYEMASSSDINVHVEKALTGNAPLDKAINSCYEALFILMVAIENKEKPNLRKINHQSKRLATLLCQSPEHCFKFYSEGLKSPVLLDRLVRVGLLAGLFANYLEFEFESVVDLVKSGLLHDVGMMTINRNSDELSASEAIQKHVDVIHDIIEQDLMSTSCYVCDAIITHHERVDGTGYPSQLKDEEISFWGKIVAILSAFDGIASGLQESNPQNSLIAANDQIQQRTGTHFDSSLCRSFDKFLGSMINLW